MLKLGEKNGQKEVKYNDIVMRNEKKSLHQNMESMTKYFMTTIQDWSSNCMK
jgi:hypothetical protein